MEHPDAPPLPTPAPTVVTPRTGRGRRVALLLILLLLVAGVVGSTQVTIFVIQPLGALPEGRTIVIPRGERMQFIDSADAVCEREQGGVNLLCRGMVLAAIGKNDNVLLRLPYSETLYLHSTGGKTYGK